MNKLWETVKLKYIFNMKPEKLNIISDWIAENLLILSE